MKEKISLDFAIILLWLREVIDENIVSALKNLPIPLLAFDGKLIYFEENKRKESIFEHIANKKHRLRISDINEIPKILKDKNSLQNDKKKKVFRNYIGRRTKKNDKMKYIKIVTRSCGDEKEVITSIYLLKKIVEK